MVIRTVCKPRAVLEIPVHYTPYLCQESYSPSPGKLVQRSTEGGKPEGPQTVSGRRYCLTRTHNLNTLFSVKDTGLTGLRVHQGTCSPCFSSDAVSVGRPLTFPSPRARWLLQRNRPPREDSHRAGVMCTVTAKPL